jgi:uncharacterized protein involved in exopolysaccharide biosynthesis
MNEIKKIMSKDNLSLHDMVFLVKLKKKYIKWSVISFILLSLIISITTKNEFTAKSKFLLESTTDGANNQLRGLAGLAGVNLPQMGSQEINVFTPDLYPSIASSDYFLSRVSNTEYSLESGEKVTLPDYFLTFESGSIFKRTGRKLVRLPKMIKGFFSSDDSQMENEKFVKSNEGNELDLMMEFNQIANYSPKEINAINELRSRILIEYENKILNVETKMPEPALSANVNKEIIDQFVKYITEYQTKKKSRNLKFLESRVEESQNNFLAAQMELAKFRDKNFGIVSQSEKTKEERLTAEFNIAFNIYNSLALEYEKAKIQLQNETPVFTIFEPVTTPNKPSEPNFIRNLIIFTLGGFVLGGFLTVGSIFYDYLKD